MTDPQPFEIFVAGTPGLEPVLREEIRALGYAKAKIVPGGVLIQGGWPDVWRANLHLRTATRVLARIASFRALHLAQLDKRARRVPWADVLRADVPLRVDAVCKGSKIYHAGAARERIERALTEELGARLDKDAEHRVMVRIEDDLCTVSLDTSGASLHRRGTKEAVGKAPLRETLAAAFLSQCGFTGAEPVIDPMCGSGTFVLEAAEIARGLAPGRSRAFAFEDFASFQPKVWEEMRATPVAPTKVPMMRGSDRDAGAIQSALQNAARAEISDVTEFVVHAISDLQRPSGPAGIVMVNPPYGARIGNKKLLFGLYGALGKVLLERFRGWRVGVVTSEGGLAKATGLPFLPLGPTIPLGGLKIRLHRTDPL